MSLKVIAAMFSRIISISSLTLLYSFAIICNIISRRLPRTRPVIKRCIVINCTFFNPNWFFAHIEPIVRSGYGKVILICDEPIAELPGLRYFCPPSWAAKIFSRAGAKFLWTFGFGLRYGADLFMGYHIFPSAITALICARLLGAKAAYQVTSGALELEGGGWHAENRLLSALGHQSLWIERLAFSVTRSFDLLVVRGNMAKQFIRERAGYRHHLEIITGSVDICDEFMKEFRDIDVIFVGRLTECKRPDRLIEALAIVAKIHPTLNAVFVGDGPDRIDLKLQTDRLGITDHVTFLGQRSDVPELLGRTRVFVLTSRSESVSIAMLEAMAFGVVPVVSDVGDLRTYVEDNVTGYILSGEDIAGFSKRISQLLQDEPLRTRLAQNARNFVTARCGRRKLTQRWAQILLTLMSEIKPRELEEE